MNCDIKTVIAILYKQLVSSSVGTYQALVDMLFKSYFNDPTSPEYDRSEPSKLNKGTRTLSSNITDFYVRKDKSVLLGDIKGMLKYILDKPQLHVSFFDLIINDPLISKPYKKQFALNNTREYSDDEHLAEVFYTAVTIAAYRPYYKDGNFWYADYYYEQGSASKDLFKKATAPSPVQFFTGRDNELDELHSLLQDNSTVIITGTAGIGKTEFVCAYAKKFKSEYSHIGYYTYNGSLKSIIASIVNDPLNTSEEIRYKNNLEYLSELGSNNLLIIDNFNSTVADDECYYDLLDLDCRVVLTSHLNYDEICTYELKEFSDISEAISLIRKIYPEESEYEDLYLIAVLSGLHTFSIVLYANLLKKGWYTPKSLIKKLTTQGYDSINELIPAIKDKRVKKESYASHISRLFGIVNLSDEQKSVLRMMIATEHKGVRKGFMASLMQLGNISVIDELIELGFIHESDNGLIELPNIVLQSVKTELQPTYTNCLPLIESLRNICIDPPEDTDGELLYYIIQSTLGNIPSPSFPQDVLIDFTHHAFKCMVYFGYSLGAAIFLMRIRCQHLENDSKQNVIYFADKAEYQLTEGKNEEAMLYQMMAVKCALVCKDTLFQASAMTSFAYYLFLIREDPKALEIMKLGISLFNQIQDSKEIYRDKYTAVKNYATILFMFDRISEAIEQLLSAVKSLRELKANETKLYADCVYYLGFYYLSQKDANASGYLYEAFYVLISIMGRDSALVKRRYEQVNTFIEKKFGNTDHFKRFDALFAADDDK